MLIAPHQTWIEDRGISISLAEKFGLETHNQEGRNWISLPYVVRGQVVNHKLRAAQVKDHRMDSGAPLYLWNHEALEDDRIQSGETPLIVTEGEWDALAALECGLWNVCSVPNGAPNEQSEDMNDQEVARYQFLWRSQALLDKVGRFLIATDSDGPGRFLAADLVRWFGPHRCSLVDYPEGCKDLGDVLREFGVTAVRECIDSAKPYPVKGLYKLEEFPEPAFIEPMRLKMPGMYDLLPIVPGTLTLMTGHSGMGKTSLGMSIIADMLASGISVCLGSFETLPRPILQRRLRACLMQCSETDLTSQHGRPISPGFLSRFPDVDRIIHERLSIIAQQPGDDDGEMTIDEVLALARIAVLRDGSRVLWLDPWNEIEHKLMKGEDQLQYTSRVIRALKRFARNYQVAVILVAHPKKLEKATSVPSLSDISGSNDFRNKADYGIIVHRAEKGGTLVDVHNVKVRMGLPGREDSQTLSYNWHRSSYERAMPMDTETGEC